MARVPRKGIFAAAAARVVPPTTIADGRQHRLTVVSSRGHGVAESATFDFGEFADVPLILVNERHIRRDIIAGKPSPSLRVERNGLRNLARYVRWYRENHGAEPSSATEVDLSFCHQIVHWLAGLDIADPERTQRIRFFRRFLTAIGVDGALLPSNPFMSYALDEDGRETMAPEDARRLLKRAKAEAEVIRRRLAEVAELTPRGSDPRMKGGGRQGAWNDPANRIWVMRNVIGLRLRTFDEIRFGENLRSALAGLEGRNGAEVILSDGTPGRQVGWKGHLRWFLPWSDDLMPFVVLLLLRTGWNLATVAALRSGRWLEPYPFKVADASGETHVYVVSYKTRGRSSTEEASKVIKAPSACKPWSHAYRVLKTVEELTGNLRQEILRRRSELLGLTEMSSAQRAEYERLDAIKDDLFIYKTEQMVTSLAWDTRKRGDTPRAFAAFMSRAGVKANLRQLRDAPIIFSYGTSGQNLFVAQLMASHAGAGTTALYLRRRATLNRVFEQAVHVFGLSLDLIEEGGLDVPRLRALLNAQGLDEGRVENLLDPANGTRWGNRCADPTNPPKGFDRGRAADASCRTQDCIDGCPHARWFRDSVGHVARHLVASERLLVRLGAESTEGSSLASRVTRCSALLERWPKAEAEAALSDARGRDEASADLFLGGAV